MNKDLEMIYENMYKEPEEEEEETLEEAKGHGDKKVVMRLMKQAMKDGLVDVQDVKNGWMVKSLVDDSQELIHRGEKAFHYLRRFLKRIS